MNLKHENHRWFKTVIFNLLLTAVAGVILRFAFVTEIPNLNYRNLLHGHSHMALIGWGYLAIYALFLDTWGCRSNRYKVFRNLFYLNEFSVIGMYLFFPVYGYKGIPIFFSTLHLLLSYVFIYLFLKEFKAQHGFQSHSARFVRTSLYFQGFSTLGIWVLPFLISAGFRHSAAYHMAVQFFLHFQFNGWLIFAILGLFFKVLENKKISFPANQSMIFYRLLLISTFLTYALAVTWTQPIDLIFWINSLGVLIQFIALIYFFRLAKKFYASMANNLNKMTLFLFSIAGLSFGLKVLMQTLVIIPDIAVVAYTIHNFVIGFIHLLLLGVVSCFILGEASRRKWLNLEKRAGKWGLALFLTGVVLSEFILFGQGILLWLSWGFVPHYYLFLFLWSTLLVLGVGLMFVSLYEWKNQDLESTPKATLDVS